MRSSSHLFDCVTITASEMRTAMPILLQSSGLICIHILLGGGVRDITSVFEEITASHNCVGEVELKWN